MMKQMLSILSGVGGILGIVGLASVVWPELGCVGTQQTATAAKAGTMAPDFTVELQSTEIFRLSDHLGKDVVILDFWTTFCESCVAVLQHLEVLHTKYRSRGLVVLAVSMDPPETAGRIGPFVRSHGLSFSVAHDRDSQISDLYNKRTIAPCQVLIGRDGQVHGRRETYQSGDEAAIEAAVLAALGPS